MAFIISSAARASLIIRNTLLFRSVVSLMSNLLRLTSVLTFFYGRRYSYRTNSKLLGLPAGVIYIEHEIIYSNRPRTVALNRNFF